MVMGTGLRSHTASWRLLLAGAVLACALVATTATARAAGYVPGEVVVGYAPQQASTVQADIVHAARLSNTPTPATAPGSVTGVKLIKLPRAVSVRQEIARLRRRPGVAYAVPDYVAHATGSAPPMWIPNDTGRSGVADGWERLQWNFLPAAGVNAPWAWANLRADGRPGGSGVVVAVLDTGIAYRNWGKYAESPDFTGTRFIDPYDFISHNRFPLDREGHGTFVAGLVAEATNNAFGLTGLAYGATIMPVRVLNAGGTGDASTIARGIRYAANHHAQIINLSLEFSLDVSSSDIPEIISAIRYAHRRGVVVVAAAGNEGVSQIAYPAAAPDVISVGATTRDRCLAEYSNGGAGLDLVAPGGGNDSALLTDPNCHPDRNLPAIHQMTLTDPQRDPSRFGYPGVYGTSMSSPEVAATAALVIASRVIGSKPSPEAILRRLEMTATPLGGSAPNSTYGYGLLNAGAATAPIASIAKR
jgi:serine protease